MSKVVGIVWSGGADSTHLLTQQAMKSSQECPVRAYTLILGDDVILAQQQQATARTRYLKWAARRGLPIQHVEVRVLSKTGVSPKIGQSGLWLTGLFPWLLDCDEVQFGYIKGDSFYESNKTVVISERFSFAWESLQMLTHGTARLSYPLWDVTKEDVLRHLSSTGVPGNCWWTCDQPVLKTKPCGACVKCQAVQAARRSIAAGEGSAVALR